MDRRNRFERRRDEGLARRARPFGPIPPDSSDVQPRKRMSTWPRAIISGSGFAIYLGAIMNALNIQGYSELANVYLTVSIGGLAALLALNLAESFLSLGVWRKIAVFVVSALLIVGSCVWIAKSKHDEYVLSPDDKPMPPSSTIQLGDTGGVLFGGDIFDQIDEFPFTLITMNGKPIFTLDKRDGHLIIGELILFDDNHNVLAKIKDNALVFIRPDVPQKERPNRSTLLIRDHNDDVAFFIYFRNPHLVVINGIFRNRSSFIKVDEDGISGPARGEHSYKLKRDRFQDHKLIQTDTSMGFYSDVPGTVALQIEQK